ncbi:MAG: CvpA family protein [Pirellulaceae bacterium]
MQAEESSRKPFPIRAVFLALIALGMCYFWAKQDFVVMGGLATVAFVAWGGYRAGIVRMMALFVGFILVVAIAPTGGRVLHSLLANWLDPSHLPSVRVFNRIVGAAIILLILMVARIIGRWLSDHPVVDLLNRTFGMLVGAGEGALIVLIVLCVAQHFEPLARERLQDGKLPTGNTRARLLAQHTVSVAEGTRKSILLPVVQSVDPFSRVPAFSELKLDEMVIGQAPELEELIDRNANGQLATNKKQPSQPPANPIQSLRSVFGVPEVKPTALTPPPTMPRATRAFGRLRDDSQPDTVPAEERVSREDATNGNSINNDSASQSDAGSSTEEIAAEAGDQAGCQPKSSALCPVRHRRARRLADQTIGRLFGGFN